jgi:hypothetical protein
MESDDRAVRLAALAGLRASAASNARLWCDVAATPLYGTRFRDGVADAALELGYRPTRRSPVLFYVGGRYSQDSRSRGEDAMIFNDNALTLAPGARLQPRGWSASLSAEIDYTRNLVRGEGRRAAAQTDYRVVLADFIGWDGSLFGPLGRLVLRGTLWERFFSELGGSVGYYTRYEENVIAYGQWREGARLWDDGASRFSLYWGVNAAKDGNHEFFNNLIEGAVGLELEPFRVWNLHFRAELVNGGYLPVRGGSPNPYRGRYSEFRAMTLFSQRIAIDRW